MIEEPSRPSAPSTGQTSAGSGAAQHDAASAPSQAAFLLRLNPPRATFPGDMSAAEAELMEKHFRYWAGLLEARTAIVYGPVSDPRGTWGVAIIRVADRDAASALAARDPVILADAGFRYDISLMPQLLVGA